MTPECKPGDVAVVAGQEDHPVRAIRQQHQWATEDGRYLHDFQVNARPLAVIDPEDNEELERLLTLIDEWSSLVPYEDMRKPGDHTGETALASALREFARPKPEEPTGLGAVVECDYDGHHGTAVFAGAGWVFRDDGLVDYSAGWHAFTNIRVLSRGVDLAQH